MNLMPKILAIDDNLDNLTTITAQLKSMMPECSVITAQSGPEGMERALAEQPDTILLDIYMPGMDGFETCRRLKADERTRPIPVIMITAVRTDGPSRIQGLEIGADAFLSKPIEPHELFSQIKVALRIKAAEDALRAERDSLEALVQRRTAELRESEAIVRNKLKAILEPDGDIGTLNLADIIDIQALQAMMEDFYRVSKIGNAILDVSGKVLVAVGWQEICTRFHRVHPETARNCLISDLTLAKGVPVGTFKAYRCKNNLWDVVTPIEVKGKHLGSIYVGQFLFADDTPDHELFRRQACQYGFDETEYLAALDRVPRVSRETVDAVMAFYAKLAGMISSLSYGTVKLSRDLAERERIEAALRRSEEKYRTLTENMKDVVWTLDTETMYFTYVSPSVEHLRGYTPEEILSQPFDAALTADAVDDLKTLMRQRAADCRANRMGKGVYFTNEVEQPCKDGSRVWTEVINRYVLNEKTGHVELHGVTRDITERKRAEAKLAESEEKYRVLFNAFPLGITVSDSSGNILESNARAADLLGVPKNEHETRRIDGDQWHIIRPDGKPMLAEEYAAMRALKENRLVEQVEMGIIRSDDRIVWLNVTAAPLSLDNYGVIITYSDDTERKRAEEALKDRESLLNKVFDVLPIGLWFADENGRLIRGNPAGVKIWGAEPTVPIEEYGVFKARRLPSREEIAPDDWALAHTIRKGVTIEAELLEIDAFDGHKKIILNYTAPVLDDQGKIQGAIVVNHDITEREHLHATLRHALKMESVGRLAGGVAHDFNNMLGVILGYTDMALDQVHPAEPLFGALQEIRKAAERSADLTRQLLTFARKQTIAPKVIDLNEIVDGMLKMLRRLIGEDIDLVWKPGRCLWPVKVDPSQIDQLLANLCVNARDAIAGVGRVTIETDVAAFDEAYCAAHAGFVPGEYVLLAVSDNGCGIDQETLDHLFEPFFTTKGVGQGTGLGLATVHGIVQQNNGLITVDSEPGQGATFKVYLPRHAPGTAPLPETAPGRSAEHGNETILLVEDEPAILKMTAKLLERMGYTVIGAKNPGEAIRQAEAHAGVIHLLVTDVVMPEMNGRDLAEHLLSLRPNLKRLFMSGYTADVIAHQGVLDAGVQFIQKPFSRTDLAAKLRQALEEDQGNQ